MSQYEKLEGLPTSHESVAGPQQCLIPSLENQWTVHIVLVTIYPR
jgi:hypothetical protein